LRYKKRVLSAATICVASFAVLGFFGERVAQSYTLREHPAPGTLVNVDGQRLHLHVTGQSSNNQPTIILEAGQGGFSTTWARVQASLSGQFQVVSYDRPGYGWSDADPQPRDLTRNSRQLRAALDELSISPPYLLVGHSMGGLFVSTFAEEFPEDVVGIVLADPTPPQLFESLPEEMAARFEGASSMMQALHVASQFGVLRIVNPLAAAAVDLPEAEQAVVVALSSSPRFMQTYLDENEVLFGLPGTMPPLDKSLKKPIVIFSTNAAPEGQTLPDGITEIVHGLHEAWAMRSPDGKWSILDGANHYSVIMSDVYAEQLVEAITEMAAAGYGS